MVQNMELIQMQAKLRLLLDEEKILLAGVVMNEAGVEEMHTLLGKMRLHGLHPVIHPLSLD